MTCLAIANRRSRLLDQRLVRVRLGPLDGKQLNRKPSTSVVRAPSRESLYRYHANNNAAGLAS